MAINGMRCAMVALILASALAATSCLAQEHAGTPATAPPNTAPTGPSVEVMRAYNALKANILKAAEEMPDTDYAYKPTPDIRTFARVLNHISEAQFHSCGAVNGVVMSALPKVPAETAEKDTIVETLTASFAECDKAFLSVTDHNLSDLLAVGTMKRSRIGLLWGTVSHDNEQYTTLALYMRLKGMTPPSSEK